MGITSALSAELWNIQTLTGEEIEQLKTLVLDFFAAAYAGYAQNRAFNNAVESVILAPGGEEESVVLFHQKKAPARLAAFMNVCYGHGSELDDGNKKAAGHQMPDSFFLLIILSVTPARGA